MCHFNAGANSQDTRKNRNFDTGNRGIPAAGAIGSRPNGMPIFDGGFGGIGDSEPTIDVFNFDPQNPGFLNGFGNGSFNTRRSWRPPTPPTSSTTTRTTSRDIEVAVFFYTDNFPFPMSPAAKELQARFGTPIQFSTEDGFAIGRFLRVLNIAFNLDIAKQRLSAAQTLDHALPRHAS